MIYSAILIASLVLLAAFAVERLGRATGMPSVIVMIGIGLVLKPLLASLGFVLDGLEMVVPVLGTVGLVLIVLKGAQADRCCCRPLPTPFKTLSCRHP